MRVYDVPKCVIHGCLGFLQKATVQPLDFSKINVCTVGFFAKKNKTQAPMVTNWCFCFSILFLVRPLVRN